MKRFVLLLVMAFSYICGFAQMESNVDINSLAETSQSLWIISPFIILPSCLLILAFISFKIGNLTGYLHRLNWGIYATLCILQMVYLYLALSGLINLPETNYVILTVLFTSIVQIISTWTLVDDFRKDCNAKLSLWIGPVGIIVGLLYIVFVSAFGMDVSVHFNIAFCLIAACQVVQSIKIFKEVRKTKGDSYAILMVLTYLVGAGVVISSAIFLLCAVLPFLLIYWYFKYKPKETEEDRRRREAEEEQRRLDAAYYESRNY